MRSNSWSSALCSDPGPSRSSGILTSSGHVDQGLRQRPRGTPAGLGLDVVGQRHSRSPIDVPGVYAVEAVPLLQVVPLPHLIDGQRQSSGDVLYGRIGERASSDALRVVGAIHHASVPSDPTRLIVSAVVLLIVRPTADAPRYSPLGPWFWWSSPSQVTRSYTRSLRAILRCVRAEVRRLACRRRSLEAAEKFVSDRGCQSLWLVSVQSESHRVAILDNPYRPVSIRMTTHDDSLRYLKLIMCKLSGSTPSARYLRTGRSQRSSSARSCLATTRPTPASRQRPSWSRPTRWRVQQPGAR